MPPLSRLVWMGTVVLASLSALVLSLWPPVPVPHRGLGVGALLLLALFVTVLGDNNPRRDRR